MDGNNVIGAVADGRWREGPAVVRRLLGRSRCYQQRTGDGMIVVLDMAQRDLPSGLHDGVEVCYPRRQA